MCTWINELPSNNESSKNMMIFIKPSEPREYYRFRILGFRSGKSDRTQPFIERYIHQIWAEDENGSKHPETVVCPVSSFVRRKWYDDPYTSCPICKFAGANFAVWKQSNWKDKESARKYKQFGRKYEACIPVYVINDPVYPQNNGHLRVFTFNDKKQFEEFYDLLKRTAESYCVFNGKNAVDFYIRMEAVEELVNEGKPNQYTWKHNVIKQIGFTKKPYDIPAINKELIDAFPFDEMFYTASQPDELEHFYNRFVKVSNDDIPEENEIHLDKSSNSTHVKEETDEEAVDNSPTSSSSVKEEKTVATTDIDDIDSVVEDISPSPSKEKKEKTGKKETENDITDITETVLNDNIPDLDTSVSAKGNKKQPVDDDIESLLNDLL